MSSIGLHRCAILGRLTFSMACLPSPHCACSVKDMLWGAKAATLVLNHGSSIGCLVEFPATQILAPVLYRYTGDVPPAVVHSSRQQHTEQSQNEYYSSTVEPQGVYNDDFEACLLCGLYR